MTIGTETLHESASRDQLTHRSHSISSKWKTTHRWMKDVSTQMMIGSPAQTPTPSHPQMSRLSSRRMKLVRRAVTSSLVYASKSLLSVTSIRGSTPVVVFVKKDLNVLN